MESWRLVWRDGFAPVLTTDRAGGPPRRPRGGRPPADAGLHDHPAPAACACRTGRSRPPARSATAAGRATGWRPSARSRSSSPACCFEADQRLGEPAACRWFLNWFDDTPRDEMRRELLAEVELALERLAGRDGRPGGRRWRVERPGRRRGLSGAKRGINPQPSALIRRRAHDRICRHCPKSKVNRPRGLCWSCYYTPGRQDLYPSTSKYARRGVGNFTGNAPLPERDDRGRPGSPEKIAVLAERAKQPPEPVAPARRDAGRSPGGGRGEWPRRVKAPEQDV